MSLIPIAYLDIALVALHERHPVALLRALVLRLALIFFEDAFIERFGCLITRERADIADPIPPPISLDFTLSRWYIHCS